MQCALPAIQCSRGHGAVQECCVPSGLNIEATGDSIVFIINYVQIFPWRDQIAVNMTWALFRGKLRKHSE